MNKITILLLSIMLSFSLSSCELVEETPHSEFTMPPVEQSTRVCHAILGKISDIFSGISTPTLTIDTTNLKVNATRTGTSGSYVNTGNMEFINYTYTFYDENNNSVTVILNGGCEIVTTQASAYVTNYKITPRSGYSLVLTYSGTANTLTNFDLTYKDMNSSSNYINGTVTINGTVKTFNNTSM